MINLVDKRDVARNKANFNEHFLCTFRKAPHAVWLNVNRLQEMSQDERFQFIIDLFHMLELDE